MGFGGVREAVGYLDVCGIEKYVYMHCLTTGKFLLFNSYTGCSLNIVFFPSFFYIFRTLASLGFTSVLVSVHNGRSNTSAAAAELAELRKITTL